VARILVVEDDARISGFVERVLCSRGWLVQCASNGTDAVRLALSDAYALILLDLLIPGVDGEEVLRRVLAARPAQRVMVVSAVTDRRVKVACLEAGAVDYLCKPFSIEELLARVHARLREPPLAESDRYVRGHGISLDSYSHKAHTPTGEVSLTEREFLLLARLLSENGRVFSRQELLSDVWGFSFDPGSNVVDVYIRRLRFKLGSDTIETIRNVGYRFQRPRHAPYIGELARTAVGDY
jgi:two-component system, OmpR family, response regulator